ncbi:hypothetical protein [Streptomyces noursei]|uniref:hypothetical protein n=1 Tax=Streptomyces noursei TaxID=1971 RepID=UPI0021A26305|nr:hypothetical protein [Streptomyces noursei]UWS77546.1 hypothetical protein N1H47_40780 [Streptomyces noursei]
MSESPFEVAAGQAAQSAFMSLRLLISIGTVLRSSVEKEAAAADPDRAEKVRRLRAMEPELSPQEISDRYAAMVRETFRPELAEALVNAEQWPQMAAELHQLDRAGVDVRSFLGDASRTAERIMREMAPTTAERWERTVRSHLPTETAEALVSAEEWPQLAEQMQQMQDAGLNVPGVLQDVARNGSTMQEAMRSAWQKTSERVGRLESEAAPAPARSRQTGPAPVNPRRGTRQDRRSRNPLAPDGRAAAFAETGMGRAKQERYARLAAEVISDQHVAGLLVVSTQWPEIAVQMRELEARSIDVGPRLAQIGQELGRQAATGQPVNVAAAAATVLGRPVSSKQRNARPAAEVTKPAPATEPKATTERRRRRRRRR